MNIVSKLKNITFVLFAFAIPFSVALTNILIVIFTFFWLTEGRFIEKIKKIKSANWIGSLVLIIILYLIGLLNGNFHADSVYVLKRVLILLFFVPIYTSDISLKNCKIAIHVFLATNLVAAFTAILINFELIQPIFSNNSISAFLLYNYHNILLSFSSILALILFVKSKHKLSFIYLLMILIFSASIFTEAGRAGQLTYNLFIILFAVIYFRRKIIFSISLLLFLYIVNSFAYSNSPIFKHRVNHLNHIVKNEGAIKNKKEKKIAIRYIFYDVSFKLIKQKPIFGYGTGSFYQNFHEEIKKRDLIKYIDEDIAKHKTPHNNYLYILFELGVLGLLAFLSLFYFQIKELLNSNKSNLAALLLPSFLLVLLFFDSYMFIFTITIFYIYMYKIFQKISN